MNEELEIENCIRGVRAVPRWGSSWPLHPGAKFYVATFSETKFGHFRCFLLYWIMFCKVSKILNQRNQLSRLGSACFKFSIIFWVMKKKKKMHEKRLYTSPWFRCTSTLPLYNYYNIRSLGCVGLGRGGTFNGIFHGRITTQWTQFPYLEC